MVEPFRESEPREPEGGQGLYGAARPPDLGKTREPFEDVRDLQIVAQLQHVPNLGEALGEGLATDSVSHQEEEEEDDRPQVVDTGT